MIKINKDMLDATCLKANESPRKRKNLNFHTEVADTIQRMLNAIQPGSYVQPHMHTAPDKREVFILLTGRLLVVEFDTVGRITQHAILDTAEGSYGCEIAPKTYHTIIALRANTVLYEYKDGPYDPDVDKNFALWAPCESDGDASIYNQTLLSKLGLQY